MTEPTPIIRKPRYLQTSLALFAGLLLLVLVLVALRQPSAHASQATADHNPVTSQPPQSASISQQQAAPTLSICSQHAPKCPLTAAGWPAEPDGWQYTGKKWVWVPGTRDLNREFVWEYSQPYTGDNPDFYGQREDHYASCPLDAPEDCSLISGTYPVTYDWERWKEEGDNYRMMQLGNVADESHLVGETDCSSGIFYPVVDHLQPYTDTPMYNDSWGECIGGGYVAAHLSELWGEPLSQKRLILCDNPVNGVPANLSPVGNTICKISPYVGIIYQRYNFSAPNDTEIPGVGCEAVLYAWGWEEPRSPDSGQVYQSWFRNGELRFTRWYGLYSHVTPGNPPAPDDHAWWNSLCQNAWTEEGNWLYTGIFRAGNAEYTDQANLPTTNIAEITPSGASLYLEEVAANYIFPAGSFTDTVRIVEYIPDQRELPATPGKFLVGSAYHIFAEHPVTLAMLTPTLPYTVTVQYVDSQVGSTESSLALYWWDGHQWLRESTSAVDLQANTVSATPQHFSLWAVMAEARRMYLPHLSR